MMSFLKNIIKKFLRLVGYKLGKIQPAKKDQNKPALKIRHVHDPAYSYTKKETYRQNLYEELAEIARGFFSDDIFHMNPELNLQNEIKSFFSLYRKRKYTDNTSGSGFHNAFWLFLFCKMFHPELIVESGVWKAHTTWLFEQACPQAAVVGFDRNLSRVEYQNLSADLFEYDWGDHQFNSPNPEKSLVFFDCHVNHAQRILEAKEKGFKHLLFDDNPPVHKIFSDIPGIPTASMLYHNQGLEEEEITWCWHDREVQRLIDPLQVQEAAKLIRIHKYFPDVGGPSRYGGYAFLTYVQI